MKLRPSSPLEFARPVGYRRDFDISSNATLCAQAQATTTHRARTSPSACVVRSMNRTPVTLFSSEIITSRTIELGTISSFPVLSAGLMCPSNELYLAATSQPAMQLPQKWQAGRVAVGTVRVDLRTWMILRPSFSAPRLTMRSLHFIGAGGRKTPSGRSSR